MPHDLCCAKNFCEIFQSFVIKNGYGRISIFTYQFSLPEFSPFLLAFSSLPVEPHPPRGQRAPDRRHSGAPPGGRLGQGGIRSLSLPDNCGFPPTGRSRQPRNLPGFIIHF